MPSAAQALPAPAALPVDFSRDIQPVLAEHCYQCHGPEKQKNGLRLDSKAEALKGGDSGPAIIPGKSAESRLIHYVAGLDPDTFMPPKGERLSAEQIGLLRAWIEQGAVWPDAAGSEQPAAANAQVSTNRHWAYLKPVRPELPSVKNSSWARNAIDHFVLARLEKERLGSVTGGRPGCVDPPPQPRFDRPPAHGGTSGSICGRPKHECLGQGR